jgi:hypothetical protein
MQGQYYCIHVLARGGYQDEARKISQWGQLYSFSNLPVSSYTKS